MILWGRNLRRAQPDISLCCMWQQLCGWQIRFWDSSIPSSLTWHRAVPWLLSPLPPSSPTLSMVLHTSGLPARLSLLKTWSSQNSHTSYMMASFKGKHPKSKSSTRPRQPLQSFLRPIVLGVTGHQQCTRPAHSKRKGAIRGVTMGGLVHWEQMHYRLIKSLKYI